VADRAASAARRRNVPAGAGRRLSQLLSLPRAAALGLLHGPAELLPISSSAHIALVPWLLRWPYAELDDDLRKSFEVALHAGTAVGMAVGMREQLGGAARALNARRLLLLAIASTPAAVSGYALERPIERRLGGAGSIAIGLVIGSAASLLAELVAERRRWPDARIADAVSLGLAQAAALFPGVSRSGATVAAARARGFARADARVLARVAAVPVIAGATALKAMRISRRDLPPGLRSAFAVGISAAAFSALACARAVRALDRAGPGPVAAYRLALAGVVVQRLRSTR